MHVGIIGLLNSGKSTLFEVLTGHASQPHERINVPRHGIITLLDERLDDIARVYDSKKITQPVFELVDLPPMRVLKTTTDSDPANLLDEVKNCKALIQVVRQFANPAVPGPETGIDPVSEKHALDSELALLDLAIIENRIERIEKMRRKKPDFYHPREPDILQLCKETLENEEPLTVLEFAKEDEKLLRGYQFLTLKPRVTVINLDESEIPDANSWIEKFEQEFPAQKGSFAAMSCQSELELLEFSDEQERLEFSRELGIDHEGRIDVSDHLMKAMDLIRFLTGGPTEAHSWLINKGAVAQEAAGAIHTDIERGFIRAEVITFEDLMKYGSEAKCKEAGKYRLEGKQYVVQDGDVIYFRFNV